MITSRKIRIVAMVLCALLCVQGMPAQAIAEELASEDATVVAEREDANTADQPLATQEDPMLVVADDEGIIEDSEGDDAIVTEETDDAVVADSSEDDQTLTTQAATVTYNLNTLSPFAGRTRAEVVRRYSSALNVESSYEGSDSTTYYTQRASTEYPYVAGQLTTDTLKTMHDMTDYFRWLVGVDPLEQACVHSADLQAGALVRNFDFNHSVDSTKKPSDMSDALWNQGANANHNIIAIGYNPHGSIIGWINEGYNLSSKSWDTLGHRYALIGGSVYSVQFGYAGSVAIGLGASYNNDASGKFYAFPAPGYMPNSLVYASESAWSLDLDTQRVMANNTSDITVRITNQNTQKSWSRTTSNGTLYAYDGELRFVQPDDATGWQYSDSYRVVVSGLTDVATGNAAEVSYTVNFVDVTNELGTYVTSVGADYSDLVVYQTLKSEANLQKVAAVLPSKVTVRCSSGMVCTVPVAGAWKLDAANKCYTNTASASNLPSNVCDKKSRLAKISIPYKISSDSYDAYNSLSISPYQVDAGGTVQVSVYRTNVSTDSSRVFKVVPRGDGTYSGELWLDNATSKWFDQEASDASWYGASHVYTVKNVTAEQAGEYVSIYFNKDWGDSAYVSTSFATLDVTKPSPAKPSIADAKISGVKAKYYTGKAIKQSITVKHAGKTLKLGTHYTVSYSANKAVGTASITIKGKGNYAGKKTIKFKILPRKTSLTKATARKGGITLAWKKAKGAGGYQVQYATKKSFKGAKSTKVSKASTKKLTLSKLKSGKSYYVRIRSYKKVGSKTYYSAWSAHKRIKVK